MNVTFVPSAPEPFYVALPRTLKMTFNSTSLDLNKTQVEIILPNTLNIENMSMTFIDSANKSCVKQTILSYS